MQVMTTKRMVQLSVQPLTHIELINALSTKDPIYKEEEDAFLSKLYLIDLLLLLCVEIFLLLFADWFSKTPTCRKKQRALELELAKLEEANEKKKKKGKKK